MMTSGTRDSAAAKGRLGTPKLARIRLPMNCGRRDQRRGDVVAQGQREREDRARHQAGKASGRTTRRNVISRAPPRSADASSSELGIRSRPA